MATWKKLAYYDDVVPKSLFSAKGSIAVASGASTPADLAIGTAAYVLTVSGGTAVWAAPATPAAHKTTHQDGGADEISVAALSGTLADDQHVIDAEVVSAAAAMHLNEFAAPDGARTCGGQQFTDIVDHIVADAAARGALTPVVGKRVFQTDELAEYVCTASA